MNWLLPIRSTTAAASGQEVSFRCPASPLLIFATLAICGTIGTAQPVQNSSSTSKSVAPPKPVPAVSAMDRAFEALCNGRSDEAYKAFSSAAESGDVVGQWYAATHAPPNTQGVLRVVTSPTTAIVVNNESGKWFQKGADAGDPRATERLALLYDNLARYYGNLPTQPGATPIDTAKAPEVRQIAAQKAVELHAKATLQKQNLSPSVLRAYKNAERSLLAIAAKGNGGAAWELALLYAQPSAIADDATKEKWTQAAVNLNVPDALRSRSAELSRTDAPRSLELLRQAAAAGSVAAMTDLATRYMLGMDGVPKDSTQEKYWRTRAAEKGDFNSITSMMRDLLNDPFRPDEAEKWALQAAALRPDQKKQVLGDFYKQLGETYLQGLKGDRDLDKGEGALKQAQGFGSDVERDLARVQAFRGLYALAGFHEPQNFPRAANTFQACSSRDPVCAYYLGYMQEFGKGLPADPEAARRDYESAERFGLKKAVKHLADLYEKDGNYVAVYAHLNAAAEKAPDFADRRNKIVARLSSEEVRRAQEQSNVIYKSRDPMTKVPLSQQGMQGLLYMSDDSWIVDEKSVSPPPAPPAPKTKLPTAPSATASRAERDKWNEEYAKWKEEFDTWRKKHQEWTDGPYQRWKDGPKSVPADPDWIPEGLLSRFTGEENAWRARRAATIEARSAIDRIRDSAHQNIPTLTEVASQGGVCFSNVENQSSAELRVYFTGPSSEVIHVAPGTTQSVLLSGGDYELAAEAVGGTITPFYGRQSTRFGGCYKQLFAGDSRPSSTPSDASGSQRTISSGPVPSQPGSVPTQTDIRGEIDSIARSGQYSPLPDAQLGIAKNPNATTATRIIRNDTMYALHLLMSGPVDRKLDLPPNGSISIELPPGSYRVAARVDSSGVQPFYGVQVLEVGIDYTSQFYIK